MCMFPHPHDETAGLEASDLDILVQLDLAAEAEPFVAVTLPQPQRQSPLPKGTPEILIGAPAPTEMSDSQHV